MASSYSDLKIELIGTGEQSGSWGTTTNTNLGTAIEEAIAESVDVAFSSGTVTLTLTNSNGTQSARHLRLKSPELKSISVPSIVILSTVTPPSDCKELTAVTASTTLVPSTYTHMVLPDGTPIPEPEEVLTVIVSSVPLFTKYGFSIVGTTKFCAPPDVPVKLSLK